MANPYSTAFSFPYKAIMSRGVTIQISHDTIQITIWGSRYDMITICTVQPGFLKNRLELSVSSETRDVAQLLFD